MKSNLSFSLYFIVIILIFSNSQLIFSKNWELFPPNAKLWYKTIDGRVNSISADSLYSENNYLFNTKLLDSITRHCFDSISYSFQMKYFEYNKAKLNLVRVIINQDNHSIINNMNDTTIIKHTIIEGEISKQYIQMNNQIDEIQYICLSQKADIINNQIDSIKEIYVSSKLFPNKNTTIILSKNHGIRKFFNFYFLFWANDKKTSETYDVIGYESKDETFGYKPLDLRDSIFNWKVGDIRTIENYDYHFPNNYYIVYLDSVIDLKNKGEELQISFSRVYKDKSGSLINKGIIYEKYNLKDFNNYFNEYNQIAILDGIEDYDRRHFIFIIDSINFVKNYGVENFALKLFDIQKRINSENCEIRGCLDCEMTYTFIPGPGLVHITINSVWTSYWDMRGYRQGDKVWGLLDLPMDVEESENSDQYLVVYPNPASNELNIKYDNSKIENIVISNILGEVLLSFEFSNDKSINISILPKGIYFLKTGNTTKMFVKQ
jgi:hypothetical protein